MNGFLHSLPWTIALALAQAGDDARAPDLSDNQQTSSTLSELSAPDASRPSSALPRLDEEQRSTELS